MQGLRYIEDVVTLKLDFDKCTGCRVCTLVCPHRVFEMSDGRARIRDLGACIECGACARNCAWGAISVNPGVGCAEAIIHSWIYGGEPTCGCSTTGTASSCCGPTASVPAEPPATSSSCCATTPEESSCGCSSEPADKPGSNAR